jgi:hypothetical protein
MDQINIVVEQLQAAGKRVLVILPSCYVPKTNLYVPNNVRYGRTRERLIMEDIVSPLHPSSTMMGAVIDCVLLCACVW